MTKDVAAWNEYFIPGSATMRNKLDGVTDAKVLAVQEDALSTSRMAELEKRPIPGKFDAEHMRQIHEYLFQDTYDWAGQTRTVNMDRSGLIDNDTNVPFTPHQGVERASLYCLSASATLDDLADQSEFTSELANTWCKANAIHAFRDGNLRTEAVFFRQVAAEAGWDLDISRLDPRHPDSIHAEFIESQEDSQDQMSIEESPDALHKTLSQMITPKEPELERAHGVAPAAGQLKPEQSASTQKAAVAERMRRFPELASNSDEASGGHDASGDFYER